MHSPRAYADYRSRAYMRLQTIDPEHASKVFGYLLLKDDSSDQELFQLAFSHESVLQAIVLTVKKELGLTSRDPNLVQSAEGQHFSSSSFQIGPPSLVPDSPFWSLMINNISSFSNEQDGRNPLHAMDLPFRALLLGQKDAPKTLSLAFEAVTLPFGF
ncbi:hypothetical protein GOP47_0023335 [Adiantum capillus-veneris]|uniref:AtC3H46-like PABC-like domain-containing protein n=1 Tax=Adiantum capillus-veneris TaxID=13818 RepID=A0A9D4U3S9_ADICA|nr:hypothetical protein GOP47_0023335 [Adiantum capillus-veneris]